MVRISSGFDISPARTAVLLSSIVAIYCASTIPELQTPKDWPDYDFFGPMVADWKPADMLNGFDYHVKYALAKVSVEWLGNHKIMPLVYSVLFVFVTYLFAVQLSGKRYAGLLAACVVLASSVWRSFDTSAVHSYDWALFFMASLYMIKRKWQFNPLFFVLSILSKSLAVLFIPFVIFMIIKSDNTPKQKTILCSTYAIMGASFVMVSTYFGDYSGLGFSVYGFMNGAVDWLYLFVVPDFWMAALMPVTMLLMLALASKGNKQAWIVFAGMLTFSLYGGFLEALTDNMWNEPYRYAPLVSMFGIGIAVMITGFIARTEQKKLRIDLGKV